MKSQKKQYYNALKEQQKCCKYIYMVKYSKVNVKLSDTQLKIQKNAVKKKADTTLEMIYHMSYYWQQDKKQSQEMLLITISQLIWSFLELKFLLK